MPSTVLEFYDLGVLTWTFFTSELMPASWADVKQLKESPGGGLHRSIPSWAEPPSVKTPPEVLLSGSGISWALSGTVRVKRGMD